MFIGEQKPARSWKNICVHGRRELYTAEYQLADVIDMLECGSDRYMLKLILLIGASVSLGCVLIAIISTIEHIIMNDWYQ